MQHTHVHLPSPRPSARVVGDIGGEDRGELAFHGQRGPAAELKPDQVL
jgi:hypothetical protein